MVGPGSSSSVCAKHGVETRLRCAECGKPICLRCQVRTGVGLKCAECAALPANAVRRRRIGSGAAMFGGAAAVLLVAVLVVTLVLRGPGQATVPTPPVGKWSSISDVPGIRGATNSLALRDGTVLIAGGGVGSIPLDGSQLWDPVQARWTATGPLHDARRGNGMAVLADGRVMVAGGVAGSTVLASAEIYDLTTRNWTPVAAMNRARLGPSLTGLADGKVLAAGGITSGVGSAIMATATAELFDPRTGTWTPLSPMLEARNESAAILLKDGRVLIEGGLSGTGVDSPTLATAELFDPVVGVFTRTGSLRAARHGHVATLLSDGHVLVAGGSGSASNVLLSELFNPETGSWSPTGSLTIGRHLAAATLLSDGRVLIAGGETAQNVSRASLKSAEVYNPVRGKWARAADMSCPRSNLALSALNGGGAIATGGDATFPGEPPKAQSCAELFRP